MKSGKTLLRKLLAPRVTDEQAVKISHVHTEAIHNKLMEPGLEISSDNRPTERPILSTTTMDSDTIMLDIRNLIQSRKDPLPEIMKALKETGDKTLLIVNSFEPVPLINMLKKKGYQPFTEKKSEDVFLTCFKKTENIIKENAAPVFQFSSDNSWKEAVCKYEKKMIPLDVRQLEMPWPMINILNELSQMDQGRALHIMHHKIPHLLLPELVIRGYSYRIKESESGFQLLIFKEK